MKENMIKVMMKRENASRLADSKAELFLSSLDLHYNRDLEENPLQGFPKKANTN